MNEKELTDKLREKYVEEVSEGRKKRTLEEALQEALDNTTPETSGHPNHNDYEVPEDPSEEWI